MQCGGITGFMEHRVQCVNHCNCANSCVNAGVFYKQRLLLAAAHGLLTEWCCSSLWCETLMTVEDEAGFCVHFKLQSFNQYTDI